MNRTFWSTFLVALGLFMAPVCAGAVLVLLPHCILRVESFELVFFTAILSGSGVAVIPFCCAQAIGADESLQN